MRGPAFESINVIPIVNDSAAETALRAGDIDFTEIATGSVDRLKADSRFQSLSRNTLDYQFLAMNVTDELLKDPNLRQAIRSAIDVPGIIEAAYDGKWTRANAIIPKNMGLGYWKGAPVYQRDVEKAKAFLAKTGKSNITLTLATQDDEADKTVVQVIQANLKDIGITTELRITDPATFNAIPGAGGGGKNRQLVYGGYVRSPTRRGRRSGSPVPRTASGTGTTGATRLASTACTTRPSRRRIRPSARRCTSSCRSSGMPSRAWSGSPIRRASTPAARA